MSMGQSLRRLEDVRFLTGRGRYTDDIAIAGAAWGVVVRSPHAHASIVSIDTSAARQMPGVLGVYTAADLAGLGPIPCQVTVPTVDGMRVPDRFALAADRVRHVGEPVCFVVAETLRAARDAAEACQVDYAPLPAVVEADAALEAGAMLVWPEIAGNVAFTYVRGDAEAVAAAFAGTPHTVDIAVVNNRIIVAALETRAAIGDYDPDSDTLRLTFSGAQVHGIRDALADAVFRVDRARLQVVAPDVGGGFGVKNAVYPEYVLVLWAARQLRRTVRWVAERGEDFVSTAQGRDNLTRGRLALGADGAFLALEVDTIANMGAAMSSGAPSASTIAAGNAVGGGYRFAAVVMRSRGVYTHTVPTDAYRGAGKPEINYILERLIDTAAAQLGHDPVALRRRNLIDTFPHHTPIGTTIDGGRFAANIRPALAAADVAGFDGRREQSARAGRLRGIGVTCFLETARGAPDEGAEIRFEADGRVALLVGSQSNGQGHETSFPQLMSVWLGLPIEAFRYCQGDTEQISRGHGHGGARSLHQAGTALIRAAELVIEKGRRVAARLLQAGLDEVRWENGAYTAAGRSVELREVARLAEPAERLDTLVWNKLDLITFPNGVHVAEVDVDPETGAVDLLRYTAVDDYGEVVNPMLTIGQVQGGLAQGIGQALLERTVFDPDSGQLLSGSLMDYCLPRASDLPDLDVHLDGVATSANPIGSKGAGQAGAIAAPQAVMAALLNALAPLGVHHLDMPATPERVWRVIRSARRLPA